MKQRSKEWDRFGRGGGNEYLRAGPPYDVEVIYNVFELFLADPSFKQVIGVCVIVVGHLLACDLFDSVLLVGEPAIPVCS